MVDEGRLKNCHIKLEHEVRGSGSVRFQSPLSSSNPSTASQCADLCYSMEDCRGFRFEPLADDIKCKTFTSPVFSKEENSTVAVGWCPRGKFNYWHIIFLFRALQLCFQTQFQANVS